jgi:DnaJ-class molecular chaperone
MLFEHKMLFDNGNRDAPGIPNYQQQLDIPLLERCESCDGLGLVRWRFSFLANKDWKVCSFCQGHGRKVEEQSNASGE